jgi:hypothetical protein
MKNLLLAFLLALTFSPSLSVGTAAAVELQLENGWTSYSSSTGTPEAFLDDGIVYFKGAMSGGASGFAFTLPVEMRPSTNVWVAVDLCNSTVGRLNIQPSGVVSVQADDVFSDAQCFTSLDGASFAQSATGFTNLALVNGWTVDSFGSGIPAARKINGIVHLKGGMANGTSSAAFTLPPEMRPPTAVYVETNLFAAAKGRLWIQPNGVVSVVPFTAGGDAQNFTGLDGVTFDATVSGQIHPTLLNGWIGAPFVTSVPAASLIKGVVHLKGSVASGNSSVLFNLPTAMLPESRTYVPVDLCNGAKGRLFISTTGSVSVEALGSFADAQCFTSLDGAKFVAEPDRFVDLTLVNDWIGGPFSTSSPGVALFDNTVHFRGSIWLGSSSTAFTLPVEMRPEATVYVPVDMCNATTGRLIIPASGVVQVQAETDFANAQCFTSLDGAKFVPSATGATPLALANDWVGGSFLTSAPAVSMINGIVYLKGAMSGGTTAAPFTLPDSVRPPANVYLYTNLFAAAKGRLYVPASGAASVVPYPTDSQGFTSLDGLTFDPDPTGSTPLTLVNGWAGGSFSTSSPAATRIKGIVHLMGAMSGGSSGLAFTLPAELRPKNVAYVPVDLFGGTKGRLVIQPNGTVSVQAEGPFADAGAFTSLDGASFAVPEPWGLPPLLAGLLLLAALAAGKARREQCRADADGSRRAATEVDWSVVGGEAS